MNSRMTNKNRTWCVYRLMSLNFSFFFFFKIPHSKCEYFLLFDSFLRALSRRLVAQEETNNRHQWPTVETWRNHSLRRSLTSTSKGSATRHVHNEQKAHHRKERRPSFKMFKQPTTHAIKLFTRKKQGCHTKNASTSLCGYFSHLEGGPSGRLLGTGGRQGWGEKVSQLSAVNRWDVEKTPDVQHVVPHDFDVRSGRLFV